MKTLRSIREGFYRNTSSGRVGMIQDVINKLKKYSPGCDSITETDVGGERCVLVKTNGYFNLEGCPDKKLGCKVIVDSPYSLNKVYIENCGLESLDEFEFKDLKLLHIIGCNNIKDINMSIHYADHINTNSLYIFNCSNLKTVKLYINNINSMEGVRIENCSNLEYFSIHNIKSIDKYLIMDCPKLSGIMNVLDVKRSLLISKCPNLKGLGGIKKVGFGKLDASIYTYSFEKEDYVRGTELKVMKVHKDFDLGNVKISNKCGLFMEDKWVDHRNW